MDPVVLPSVEVAAGPRAVSLVSRERLPAVVTTGDELCGAGDGQSSAEG